MEMAVLLMRACEMQRLWATGGVYSALIIISCIWHIHYLSQNILIPQFVRLKWFESDDTYVNAQLGQKEEVMGQCLPCFWKYTSPTKENVIKFIYDPPKFFKDCTKFM